MPRAINASANFIKNMKSVDSAKKFFYAGGNALGNLLAFLQQTGGRNAT